MQTAAPTISLEPVSSTVSSRDGTSIAFDQRGHGPAVLLVDGAFCHRSFGPLADLAPLLAEKFTVINYDRRGRGESGDIQPYAVEREIEDIEALIDAAGGMASVFGISSGAVLASKAASRLPDPVDKLVLYEPPVVVDQSRASIPDDYEAHLRELVASDRRGDAVKYFMTKAAAVPAVFVAMLRVMPPWSSLKASAHTLAYDAAVLEGTGSGKALPPDVIDVLCGITAPTLVASGGKSPAWMHSAADAVASSIPGAIRRTLPGQNHQIKGEALPPVLEEFCAC